MIYYFFLLWGLVTKTPHPPAFALDPQYFEPIVTPSVERFAHPWITGGKKWAKATWLLFRNETQVLCAPHCHSSPAHHSPPPFLQGHDPRPVNRLSRFCMRPECEHYHSAHCLRGVVAQWRKNAELLKSKSVGTALWHVGAVVSPTFVRACAYVCVFVRNLLACFLLCVCELRCCFFFVCFVLFLACSVPSWWWLSMCVCVCAHERERKRDEFPCVFSISMVSRARSTLSFLAAVGSPALAVFKGLSCCLAELTWTSLLRSQDLPNKPGMWSQPCVVRHPTWVGCWVSTWEAPGEKTQNVWLWRGVKNGRNQTSADQIFKWSNQSFSSCHIYQAAVAF